MARTRTRRLVKKAKRVGNFHVPEEILMEILGRLPVKSLMRLSSVCKSWRNLINNNPIFISHHLRRSTLKAKGGNLLMKKQQDSVNGIRNRGPMCLDMFLHLNVHDKTLNNLPDPLPLYVPSSFQGYASSPTASSNGLLFIEKSPESYIVWNPATRRYKEICSNEQYGTCEFGDFYHYLLGFDVDAETNDYKVIRIYLYDNNAKGHVFARVQVYSRLSCSWRDIDASTFPTYQRDLPKIRKNLAAFTYYARTEKDSMYSCAQGHISSVILNGVLYWILDQSIIIGFKIRDEVFCHVPMPKLANLISCEVFIN